MKEKYINPFTDFGFKKLFGEEVNKDLLTDFLNQLLPKRHLIKELTYTKTEQLGSADLDRRAVFDLYCKSETGEKFIVELQKAKQNFFKDRSVFYSTFPIREQAKRGEWNFELNAVYTIGILDFVFEEEKNAINDLKYVHRVQLMETELKEVFYDKLTYIYLEMPKFRKGEKDLKTRFDKWLYVIKNLPRLESLPPILQEKIFEKVFETAEIARFTHEEVNRYEQSLKYYRDFKNVMDTHLEEGEKIGLEKGIKIGLEKGEQIGLEKGINKEKFTIAQKMLEKGIEPLEISNITGLSTEQIQQLKDNGNF